MNYPKRIGWIGLGNMGHPMATNLLKQNIQLTVYNRSADRAADFPEVSPDIAQLVHSCDVVFIMLSDDNAVQEVVSAIITLPIAGKCFVNMSTISLELTHALGEQFQGLQAAYMDAPVAGSVKPAQDGTLLVLAGGEQEDLDRAMPYLELLGKETKHLGPVGAGIAAKLAVNYLLATMYQGLAESVLLAEKLGIDRKSMMEIINASACGNGATLAKTQPLVQEDYTPAFALDLMLKDLKLAVAAGADQPLINTLLSSHQEAHDKGFGKDDVIAIIRSLST